MKRFSLILLVGFFAACASSSTAVREDIVVATDMSLPTVTPYIHTLSGLLYAIELNEGEQALVQISIDSGTRETVFLVPANGWLASFDLRSDGGQFVLAYAAPPPEGEINFGFTDLYLMDVDAATGVFAPRALLTSEQENELFINPVWAADGQSIYFSHIVPLDVEAYTFATSLRRLHLESGQIDLIAENGIWPQASPDGQSLAFVLSDPQTQTNSLMVAQPDGSQVREVVGAGVFTAVDAPVFSPDGQTIMFSGAVQETVSRSWWERLIGVQAAAAHSLPSDWYSVVVNGGAVTRLTEMEAVGLYGRFSPHDPLLFAFVAQNGLYTMLPDGTNVQSIQSGTFTDSLAWKP
jgi:Tol biopolymer transport system component